MAFHALRSMNPFAGAVIMRPATFLVIAVAASACASSALSEPRTAKAETRLQELLGDKVAGAPVNCLPTRNNGMVAVDDNTILFRVGRNTFYRNDPPGGCPGIGRGTKALVTRTPSSALCSGDIATVVDVPGKTTVGHCTLGDFVPYRSAQR
jgi:hypothetical protein